MKSWWWKVGLTFFYDIVKYFIKHSVCLSMYTSCTWLASSLVGEMITALKPRLAGCCRWASSGRQKAKVFPDPVGAQASSSRPWSRNQTHSKSSQNRYLHAGYQKLHACPYSRASWAVSPASAPASGSSARRLWGSGWHAGWGDTRTAAPQMCIQGRVRRSRARLCGVENECGSPKIK